jgi:hypothetical protein
MWTGSYRTVQEFMTASVSSHSPQAEKSTWSACTVSYGDQVKDWFKTDLRSTRLALELATRVVVSKAWARSCEPLRRLVARRRLSEEDKRAISQPPPSRGNCSTKWQVANP